ncbi:MAG: type II toxin-antitoxin system VapC family toxin [Gammaproteobacteria bacterium]|nr:type II toxin-antitoxin system VapC family toxin [Gammaproteobacteria bacterium]MYH15050.1 type II toxin-antitoxin system VapC family toxin [Gammaproteobacteria bacterium]MYK84477.1 type II toxin-antitoxin system VapC family toxin [Gammaproteobacteria bacterium]
MTFVDTNVFMYAVGRTHPLRAEARGFFAGALVRRVPLATSAAVLQELIHACIPVGRQATLERAMALMDGHAVTVWPLGREDVVLAAQLHDRFPNLGARDLCHLASCRRGNASAVKTFDKALAAALGA